MRHRIVIRGILAVILLLAAALDCWGFTEFHPGLYVREEYNDNIFLTTNNKKSDFVTIFNPTIKVNNQTPYSIFSLDYGLYFLNYNRYSQENETSFKDVQRGVADLQLLPGRDFSLRVHDEERRVTIDNRLPVVEANPFVNKTNLNHLTVNPMYSFTGIRDLTATLGYKFDKYAYQSSLGDDSESHTGYLDLKRDLSPRLSLLLKGAYEDYQATYSEDFKRKDLGGGFTYQVTPLLLLSAEGGPTWIDFRTSSSQQSILWNVSLNYGADGPVTMGAAYAETILVSVDQGAYRRREARANWAYHTELMTVGLTLLHHLDKYLTVVRKDESNGAVATLLVPLTTAIAWRFGANYSRLTFKPEEEKVKRYGGSTALEYRFQLTPTRIAIVSAGYLIQRDLSNFNGNSFINQIVFADARLQF